ncbi:MULTISPECIES: hypothetical protein [unclassified Streptomyces]|uniref:hypothetical protein n=1 Tax=unclassified Streptomyces TaxID=2593676 RepID=UPI0024763395|nr:MULTISPECIES: hypothetical protein [unclassified Streptomyces]MDH6450185.1 hypothetical protein [Streptomyces sp. SAI-119]MDH6499270.1 hypothetical protein [Streptomyces sp. SAI-149]
MSVALSPWDLSNPSLKSPVITVVVIVLITLVMEADAVRTLGAALELIILLCAGQTVPAAAYSNHANRR